MPKSISNMAMVPLDKKGLKQGRSGVPLSLFTDPMTTFAMYGGYEEPRRSYQLSFKLLKNMSKNSIIALIIGTRVNQIAAFSAPMHMAKLTGGNAALGFEILHKEKHQKDWSKADEARAKELSAFILNCGETPRLSTTGDMRPNFDSFLKMVARDSLTYDQLCAERVYSRSGELLEFWPVDASTIRRGARKKDGTIDLEQVYVQVVDGIPVVAYTHDDMVFFVRNPRTDMDAKGYGFSELENLIRTITSHLNSERYNMNIFTTGTTGDGILVLKGDIDSETLKEFRNEWRNVMTGVKNAGRTPVLQSEQGADYVSMNKTNKEMEYSKWMEYLITVSCGMYQMDPSEIGFNFKGGLGGQAPMFETSQEQRLKHSKDKGLRPLVGSVNMCLNQEILEKKDPDWFLQFVGLDNKSEEEIIKNRVQELNYKTLDEVREEAGLEEFALDAEKPGNIVLNPQYIQYILQMVSSGGSSGGGGDIGAQGMVDENGNPLDENGNPMDQGQNDQQNLFQ